MDQKKKDLLKRIGFIGAALLLVAACIIVAAVFLRTEGELENKTDIRNYNENSSQILLTGKDYSLDEEQEEIYMEAQQQREEPEPETRQEDTTDTIVQKDPDQQPQPGSENPSTTDDGTGNNNGSDGDGNGGDGDGSGNQDNDPKPPEVIKTPQIESNITDETYGTDLAFAVRGTDYKGRVIDKFYYTVLFDGNLMYSTESSGDGWVTYRVYGATEGPHEVSVTVTDTEGNKGTKTYPMNVSTEADVPVDEYVTLEVEANIVGFGYAVSVTEQIYKDESAAHFVRRVLESNGFGVNMDESAYLRRVYGIYPGEPNIPEPYKSYIDEVHGELYGVLDTESLGEKDFTAESGWIYLHNGVFSDVGLPGVTLQDGDIIHIGFTLWKGFEYNGTWGYFGG